MSYFFAQINPDSVCIGVSELSEDVVSEHMIAITQKQFDSGSVAGRRYDSKSGGWSDIPAPTSTPARELPAGALYLRFSFAERAGIMLAGTINPAADIKTQQLQAQVATLRSDLMSARMISLDSPGLLTGCKLLASIKVLGDDWEQRILKANVTQAEKDFG